MKHELAVAQGIVAGMSDPAILLDDRLAHVCHSAGYAHLSGMRARALERRLRGGESPFEILGSDPERDRDLAGACLESGKSMQFAEEVVTNLDGQSFTVYVTYLPVQNAGGEVVGIIQSFRDVSAEARVQGRYRELLEQERLRGDSLEREVEQRTKDLTAALEEVTRLSRIDPLTSLLNRRAFTELAEQSLKLARRHKRNVGLIIGDLDHFKKVNDNHGHQVGDRLLVATSQVLRDSVRDSDPVARFGGEEFVVLLTETARDSVAVVAERIRAAIAGLGPEELQAEDIPAPTISLGMAVFPDHGLSLDELVSHADQALYRAKESGRNRIEMYDPSIISEAAPGNDGFLRQVLLIGSSRAEAIRDALGSSYQVNVAISEATALADCGRQRFEVVIADHDRAEDGVDFLRRTLRFLPEALRVLVIDSQEVFCEVRGHNLARVDTFLLREEASTHIAHAIDDGLARRELDRQRLILSSDSVQRLFSSRLAELETLIEERNFRFAYQPIVDPRSREVHAYEALCRAQHPIFRNATTLFEAAVQSGTLWQLGRVTREMAVEGSKTFGPGVKVFVNLHPGEVDDPELLGRCMDGAEGRIVFEITERAAIPDLRRFRETAQMLSARGYEFAIDDLGAGYASLNAVALLAPEYVKIDMTMVRHVDHAPRRQQLIRRMVDFANDIGIRLVAEGVETAAEAEVVAGLGCHLAQGYFYGRPALLSDG